MNNKLTLNSLAKFMSYLASAGAGFLVSSAIFWGILGCMAGSVGARISTADAVFYLTLAGFLSMLIAGWPYIARHFRQSPEAGDTVVVGMAVWCTTFFAVLVGNLVQMPATESLNVMWVASAYGVLLLALLIGWASGSAIDRTNRWLNKP